MLASVLLLLALTGCGGEEGDEASSPRLVVSVVVDQLPLYLLERYDSLFTGGLRRLLDEGRSYPNAVHAHATTETAVGHATLATGVLPARHGVVANTFHLRADTGWVEEYSTADPESELLGAPAAPGRSPENLLAPGLADWMLLADSASRRVSISKKDRSAILHGGLSPGHVYWLSPSELRFVTSAYYQDETAAWVEDFNRRDLPQILSDSVWESSIPPEWRSLARADSSAMEGGPPPSAFPHRYAEEGEPGARGFYEWVIRTPAIDEAVLALARRSMEELELGRDAAPDLLAVGLSQTDYVGHRYGPLSREQLDNLLRLDRRLGAFFEHLDREIGVGQWVLGFSADHGVLVTPEQRRAQDRWGYRATEADARSLDSLFREGWARGGAESDRRARAARAIEKEMEIVADVVTEEELLSEGPPADSFLPLYRNEYRRDRRPDRLATRGLWIRWREGVLAPAREKGTSHGSPYLYDRRVPMIFLGSGVVGGRVERPVRTVDFAPTLAALVGVRRPGGLDGAPLFSQGEATGQP